MKALYGILMIGLMLAVVGCQQAPPAAEPTPSAPAAPAAEPTAPVEVPVAVEGPSSDLQPANLVNASDQATIDRYKAACLKGNVGLCTALKSKYGIVLSPSTAPAEPVAEEPAAEPATE